MTGRSPIRTLRHEAGERPFLVIWEVTRACDLVCAHCRADAIRERHPGELTTDEGRRLFEDLAALGIPRPLVVLTGGDPFERPDLAALVRHATGVGLHVALAPSVTPRLTRAALAELRAAGAAAVSLSLDGATPRSHDGFRGVDGVFDATLEAASVVRELGYRLQINTTVTAGTVDELPEVLAHVVATEAMLWSVFLLVPTGRGAGLGGLDAATVEDVLHWLHDVAQYVPVKTTEAPHFRRVALERAAVGPGGDPADRFGLGDTYRTLRAQLDRFVASTRLPRRPPRPPLDVNAGRGFAFVDHLGLVYPSGFLPLPAGSVRERPLSRIYRDAPLFVRLRDPEQLRGRCGACSFRSVCGGSRSRAYAVSGDPFGEDPACSHLPVGAA